MPDQTYWAEALVHSREELSQMLRAARETLGVPLSSVAEVLRIRESYLHAIEDGRFEDLPGPTYASAFLRSYAAYVGYNGDDVVAAWRQLDPRADDVRHSHNFRILETERRMPRAAMLLLSLLLLGGAYGVWHWVGGEDVSPAPPVAEVPAHLRVETATRAPASEPARPVTTSVSPVSPAAAAPAPALAAPPEPPAAATAPPQAAVPGPAAATAMPQPAAPAPSPQVASPTAAPPAAARPPATASPPAAQARPVPAAPAAPPAATQPAPPSPQNEARAAAPAVGAPAAPAAPSRVEPAQPRERTIRVTSSTILELRDPNSGEVLATVNMRAGDSYPVPPYIAYRLVPDR